MHASIPTHNKELKHTHAYVHRYTLTYMVCDAVMLYTYIHTYYMHYDAVSFNATGSRLVTASADGTSRVYNSMTGACVSILVGHEGEISKVLRYVLCLNSCVSLFVIFSIF
jgi:WD40 repeat protein